MIDIAWIAWTACAGAVGLRIAHRWWAYESRNDAQFD